MAETASARPGYAEMLRDVGERRDDVVVIDAGLATSMQTHLFAARFPERYFNLGIAEQNAVSVASGLARRGLVPLVHSFANFLARRAHDQVAVSVAWPGCNVKLVAGSCGVYDGRNGPSHAAVDDLAAITALPGMTVAEPGDLEQTRWLLDRLVDAPGPAYLRLRRFGMPGMLTPLPPAPVVELLRSDAPRCTVVVSGSLAAEALQAARMLGDAAVDVDLYQATVLQPFDAGGIERSAQRSGMVVSVENHVLRGGLGDVVAEHLGHLGVRLLRMGIPAAPLPSGDPDWLLRHCGLDADGIAGRIADAVALVGAA